jgi:hypothetical protein
MTEYLNYWLKKEKVMSKDKVTQIMDEWYAAMGKNGISVQPKASTILGTILAKHMNEDNAGDAYERYMNTRAGDFDTFWKSLSASEKEYVETMREKARTEFYNSRGLTDHNSKELLKG